MCVCVVLCCVSFYGPGAEKQGTAILFSCVLFCVVRRFVVLKHNNKVHRCVCFVRVRVCVCFNIATCKA